MSVIWYKVWYDLWRNRTRTLLAVLSIAAGVFAVGTMFGMADLLTTNLDKSHQSTMPPHLDISLGGRYSRDDLLSIKNVPGVEDVEPYNLVAIRYKLHPNDPWRQGVIHERGDFTNQKYELVQLRAGRWPKKGEIAVERMASGFLNVGIGDNIIIKMGNSERTYPITGMIRHPFVPPPQFMDLAFFFMDGQTLENFNVPDGLYSSVYVRVTPYSADYAKQVGTAIKEHLGKMNIETGGIGYQDPTKHWGRSFFDGINLTLQVLALMSVVMSAVLVYNTLSNLITQQIDQIGILKAIGGRTGTIVQIYLTGTLIYGILALLVAVPLGAFVAFQLSKYMLGLFNIDYDTFEFSRTAVTFQIISGIAVPLVAGLIPTLQGAGISVRQAIASYGLGSDYGSNWFDKAVERIGEILLPSHFATSLGNMFRRKGRLLLTQLVLVIAGIGFICVMSLSSSLSLTLDNIFARDHYDTLVEFSQNQRADKALQIAGTVRGVETAELRQVYSASMLVAGQLSKEAGVSATLIGIPSGSDFTNPLMVAGRWLKPGDAKVVVLQRENAQNNHIAVGDTVTLDLGVLGKDEWQVIGLYEPVFTGMFGAVNIYAPLDAVCASTHKCNEGAYLYVRTTTHDAASTRDITRALENAYTARKVNLILSQTESELRQTNEMGFNIVVQMLMALSIVVAIVGGIALMGTLSLSVVERTKEIGVLRAVGARSRTILGIFLMEGLLQGLLSCAIAIPFSFVFGQSLASALGQAMFSANLDYQFNWSAVGTWLVIMLVISALASILPARGATRISVRESLAYA